MKHVFEIKDFIANEESAKHIIESQVNVILNASKDLDIVGINIFINDTNADFYKDVVKQNELIKLIPTLKARKKKKEEKQSFAAFHNFIVNSIASKLNTKDLLIHIMDGTLDLFNSKSEFGKQTTRLGEMIVDVYSMMNLLNHPVWFNTASDKGNLKFGHYYTMIDFINIDESCLLDTFPECIMYSANSNLDWIIIDAEKYRDSKLPTLMMNTKYDYDFLSIKHLISKFVDFSRGYYDTMFPTVPTEVGAYDRNRMFDKDFIDYDMSKYNENIQKFKENLKEYDLKPCSINDVIMYVRETVLNKLSDSDKNKLQKYVEGIQEI